MKTIIVSWRSKQTASLSRLGSVSFFVLIINISQLESPRIGRQGVAGACRGCLKEQAGIRVATKEIPLLA